MSFNKKNFIVRPLYNLYKLLTSNRYTIGIAGFDERVVEKNYIPKVHWIKDNYKKGWFADPFILRVTESEFVLLVEEYVYKKRRGIISQITIDRSDYSIKEVKPVINTGFHLSFPAYYRKNGKVYVYPEQGSRGATWLYEYDETTCKATELRIINPNDTVDSTLLEMPEGKRLLTCTTAPDYNGKVLDFYSFCENGSPTKQFPLFRVILPKNTARNAGVFFKIGNKTYRPAQFCDNYYGEGVEIQEVVLLDGELSLQAVNLIKSPSKEYPDAFHTFNVFENEWIAVDGRRKRFPSIAKLFRKLVN